MSGPGWIKLHRQMLYNGWLREPILLLFWIYCLLRANRAQGKVFLNGAQIELQPGQFVTGRDTVFRDTGLSEQQYRTCLKRLKSTGSITVTTTNRYTMITVVNWHTYQEKSPEANEPANEPANTCPTGSQRAANDKQERKEEKKRKKETIYTGSDGTPWTLAQVFEKLWQSYPKKDGKIVAQRHFNATVTNLDDARRLSAAIANYRDYLTDNQIENKFTKSGKTFFAGWQDWVPDDTATSTETVTRGPMAVTMSSDPNYYKT